jgi:hypothetical protein
MNYTTIDIYWDAIKDVDDKFRTHCVYMYYSGDTPLYIGMTAGKTVTVYLRDKAHKHDGVIKWMKRQTTNIDLKVGVPYYGNSKERVDDRIEIQDIERALIVTEIDRRKHCRANVKYQKSFSSNHCRNLLLLNWGDFFPLKKRYPFRMHIGTYKWFPDGIKFPPNVIKPY